MRAIIPHAAVQVVYSKTLIMMAFVMPMISALALMIILLDRDVMMGMYARQVKLIIIRANVLEAFSWMPIMMVFVMRMISVTVLMTQISECLVMTAMIVRQVKF